MLKISLLFRKFKNVTHKYLNNSRVLRIRNAKFGGYYIYMNTNIREIFKSTLSTFKYKDMHCSNYMLNLTFLLYLHLRILKVVFNIFIIRKNPRIWKNV